MCECIEQCVGRFVRAFTANSNYTGDITSHTFHQVFYTQYCDHTSMLVYVCFGKFSQPSAILSGYECTINS